MATRINKTPGREYAGKEKVKLYHYDKNGKFLKEYESQAELRNKYYSNIKGKRPLFRTKRSEYNYDILPDGSFYSTYRIGRDKLLQYEKIINSKFVDTLHRDDKIVIVYNILGLEIARFKNMQIASLMTNIRVSHIYKDCIHGKNKQLKELTFKYG